MRRLLLMLSILGTALLSPLLSAAEVESLRASQHRGFSRLVLDISGPVSYSVAVESQTGDVILTIRNARLGYGYRVPELAGLPVRSIDIARDEGPDLVFSMRLDSPQRPQVFRLRPFLSRGDRLVVDLYPGSAGLREERVVPVSAAPAESATEAPGAVAPETAAMVASQASTSARLQVAASRSRSTEPVPRNAVVIESVEVDESAQEDAKKWLVEFSGTWEHEWGYATENNEAQKFESLIEPRWDLESSNGIRVTAIARLRLDATGDLGPSENRPNNYSEINGPVANDEYFELSLRELYLDAEWAGVYWRLGKQQLVWGQADGIKVMDVVNPQSFREFIVDEFDDSRIPLWMVNAETTVGDNSTLQLLWIPDTTYHELAEEETPFFLTSERLVPTAPPGLETRIEGRDTPDDPFSDSEFGARFSTFLGGWDLSVNYLYHYQDFPVLYQSLRLDDGMPLGVVTPEYERNHLVGGTFSNVFGDFTLRGELVYNSDTYHVTDDIDRRGIDKSAEFASVIGLDWQANSDIFLSGQWFQSHLDDYRGAIRRDETEQNGSLYYQHLLNNETLQFNALYLYSFSHQDSWLQMRLKYNLESNIEVWVGGDFFQGDRDGLFGQFKDEDRVLLGLKYGF